MYKFSQKHIIYINYVISIENVNFLLDSKFKINNKRFATATGQKNREECKKLQYKRIFLNINKFGLT